MKTRHALLFVVPLLGHLLGLPAGRAQARIVAYMPTTSPSAVAIEIRNPPSYLPTCK